MATRSDESRSLASLGMTERGVGMTEDDVRGGWAPHRARSLVAMLLGMTPRGGWTLDAASLLE
jgi:hypothetical protein